MKTQTLLTLAALALALAPVLASANDIPLAVTTLAHPSLRTTPTAAEQRLSEKYLAQGLLFLKKDQPKRAVEELKDAVRLAPSGDTYKALGTAYYQAGDVLKATWAYRESLQLQPDPKVRALLDSIEGLATDGQVLELRAKMDEAKSRLSAGKRDSALESYVQAWNIKRSPESAGPALRLAADLAEEDLKAKALARAIEVLASVQALKGTPDLSREDKAAVARLSAVEDQAVQLTGAKLREHQKAMLSDREAWERAVAEKLAGKVQRIDLNLPAR